jgi:catechol 1,2-dioxygenase
MSGRVLDVDGNSVPGAIVEVWHADVKGNYSHFDSTQSAFNLRRRIETLYGVCPGDAAVLELVQ